MYPDEPQRTINCCNPNDPLQDCETAELLPDIAINKEILGTGSYDQGDTVTYQLTVVNKGSATGTNVIVTDTFVT